jgi:hypothetical protein
MRVPLFDLVLALFFMMDCHSTLTSLGFMLTLGTSFYTVEMNLDCHWSGRLCLVFPSCYKTLSENWYGVLIFDGATVC